VLAIVHRSHWQLGAMAVAGVLFLLTAPNMMGIPNSIPYPCRSPSLSGRSHNRGPKHNAKAINAKQA
jgi:hypothetical protein